MSKDDPFIQTYTGVKFNLVNPQADMVNIVDIAHTLSLICRFNSHIIRHYSVASHSMHVASIVKAKTNNNRLAFIALNHEVGEVYACDLPRPLKKLLPEYSEIEKRIALCVYNAFGVSAKELEEAESVVKEADNIALVTEANQLLAQPPIDNWVSHYKVIPETKPLIKETPMQAYDRFMCMFDYFK